MKENNDKPLTSIEKTDSIDCSFLGDSQPSRLLGANS